jgi:hypothetical protein
LFDLTGSYRFIIMLSALLLIAGAILVLSVPEHR